MRIRIAFPFLLVSLILASCTSSPAELPSTYPTYDPFVPIQGTTGPFLESGTTNSALPTRTAGPTPSLAPLTVLIPTRKPQAPLTTPTPDRPHTLPTPRQAAQQYVVAAGDTLGSIAEAYGVSVQDLERANNLNSDGLLSIGQSVNVPAPSLGEAGSSFKIIPDSELVYGPGSAQFDIAAYIQSRNGYLASYTQDINEQVFTGAQVVERVAQNYSVNPRLLLALLDYRSNWVS